MISKTQMTVLNEVLSLNAQESSRRRRSCRGGSRVLNEVLSLNAQEYRQAYKIPRHTLVLNEVLSLNAQEFLSPALPGGLTLSSMKS